MPPESDNSHSSTSAWDQKHWHKGSLRPITNSTCPCAPAWHRVHNARTSKLVGKYRGFYAQCSTTFVKSGQGTRKNCSSLRQPAGWMTQLKVVGKGKNQATGEIEKVRKYENPALPRLRLNCLGWSRSREVDTLWRFRVPNLQRTPRAMLSKTVIKVVGANFY